jgi:uncharacterized protein
MNTGPQEVLSYRDLARQNARIHRQVEVDALPRVAVLMAADTASPLDVVVRFGRDPHGTVTAAGEILGRLPLTCSRCAEAREYPLKISFEYAIVATEALASELAASERGRDEDIVVASGPEVTLAELIEDEILLGLPEWLCTEEPCENRPQLDFPVGDVAVDVEAGRRNPFAALAGLRTADTTSDPRDSENDDAGADRVERQD